MNLNRNEYLDYLANYWIVAKNIGNDIKNNLHQLNNKKLKSGKLNFVNYKDINTWSIQNLTGNSEALEALGDKINYMILKGRANDIKCMIEKITSGRLKRHYAYYHTKYEFKDCEEHEKTIRDYIGTGHFRWNFKVYTLTDNEIEKIKNYFK